MYRRMQIQWVPKGCRGHRRASRPVSSWAAWATCTDGRAQALSSHRSSAPQVGGRSVDWPGNGGIHHVHLHETLCPVSHGDSDSRKALPRLLDHLAGVVDDPPTPSRARRGRKRCDLHACRPSTSVPRHPPRRPGGRRRHPDRHPSPTDLRARPSGSGRPRSGH